MFYLSKTPWLLKQMYPGCIWNIPTPENEVYLTFDDGPHPVATPFVLDTLKEFNAKATFFCIGKNVKENPSLYSRILEEGHQTGNHTQNHLNGWKVSDREYLENIMEAKTFIDSRLFRPPYGKITRFQIKLLTENAPKQTSFKIIMWDVLSADFDLKLNGNQCADKVLKNVKKGSVVVFHDSQKALPRLKIALPIVMEELTKRGLLCRTIGNI